MRYVRMHSVPNLVLYLVRNTPPRINEGCDGDTVRSHPLKCIASFFCSPNFCEIAEGKRSMRGSPEDSYTAHLSTLSSMWGMIAHHDRCGLVSNTLAEYLKLWHC